MNKVVNINLNGIIITIDELAYGKLKSYIDGLHRHFAQTEGGAEIISDIETRIAELLQLKLSSIYTVIQAHDIDEVIAIMGNPWQMGEAENKEEETGFKYKKADSDYTHSKKLRRDGRTKILGGVCSGISNYLNIDSVFIRALFLIAVFIFGTGVLLYIILWIAMPEANAGELPEYTSGNHKRLFRSEDDKMLGGVSAGVANYFGIDTVWIRILFLVALFFYGSGILLYIVLWLIIPKATTAAQKLQMKGEPIDVNNIERVIRNTFNQASRPANGILANVVSMFGQLFGFLLKTFGKFAAVFLVIISVTLMGTCFFLLFFIQEQYRVVISAFSITDEVLLYTKLGTAAIFLSIIISLLVFAFRLLFSHRIKLRYAGFISTILFIGGIILAIIAGFKYAALVNNQQHVIERQTIYPTADTLYFDIAKKDIDADEVIKISTHKRKKHWHLRRNKRGRNDIDIVFFNGNEFPMINAQNLTIKPSLTDSIEVKIIKEARGSGLIDATNNARLVHYGIDASGNKLIFDRGILLTKEVGYRYQNAEVILSIPVGTIIIMNEHVVDMMHDADYDIRTGTTYKVTQDGIACIDCNGAGIFYHGKWNDDELDIEDIDIKINTSSSERKNNEILIEQSFEGDSNAMEITETQKRVGPVTINKTRKIKKNLKENSGH